MRRNLTIQLDDAVIHRAKVVAAKRGTSVSALAAHGLERLLDADERYEAARQGALASLGRPRSHGGRTWSREELHGE